MPGQQVSSTLPVSGSCYSTKHPATPGLRLIGNPGIRPPRDWRDWHTKCCPSDRREREYGVIRRIWEFAKVTVDGPTGLSLIGGQDRLPLRRRCFACDVLLGSALVGQGDVGIGA